MPLTPSPGRPGSKIAAAFAMVRGLSVPQPRNVAWAKADGRDPDSTPCGRECHKPMSSPPSTPSSANSPSMCASDRPDFPCGILSAFAMRE